MCILQPTTPPTTPTPTPEPAASTSAFTLPPLPVAETTEGDGRRGESEEVGTGRPFLAGTEPFPRQREPQQRDARPLPRARPRRPGPTFPMPSTG